MDSLGFDSSGSSDESEILSSPPDTMVHSANASNASNAAYGTATTQPIDIQRPGLPRGPSHATRHGLRAHLTDRLDDQRAMFGTKGPSNPTPYGNHRHRGDVPSSSTDYVPSTPHGNAIAAVEDVHESLAHRFPQDVGLMHEAESDAIFRSANAGCNHEFHRRRPSGIPMGLPDNYMVDESKTWACGLPIVPDCDRASEAGGPPVTVGVEWEFLVDPSTGPYGPFIKLPGDEHFVPSVSRPDSLHNQLHLYHLSKALNDAGILAATGPEVKYALEKPGYAKARFPHVDHGLPLCERFKDYFVISVDASVVDDGMKMPNEKWASVEVASPVMTISELHKIDAAFGLLLEAFRLKTNMSYGLHVHVGNANRGFSPEWMRTVGAMCWAIAPLFDAFHPPSRGPCHGYSRGMRWFAKAAHDGKTLSASGYDDDPANSPVSFMFPTAPGCTVAYPIPPVWPGRPEIAYGRGPQAADPEARPLPSEQRIPANIEKVLLRDGKCPKCPADHHMAWCGVKRLLESKSAFDTLDMLKNACGSGGRMTYNFNNLRRQGHDDTNKPRTIEFRQHDGTMDLVAIKCWMRVCCSIVELCRPLRDPRGNGLMNSPHAVEVAHRAVEGTLCITKYDVYDFMADIGSKVAYQTYLRQRKDESDAVGLLIAGPEDDLPEENEHQHALGHLAALQPLVATLTNAA